MENLTQPKEPASTPIPNPTEPNSTEDKSKEQCKTRPKAERYKM
jgi:hypothetical protein